MPTEMLLDSTIAKHDADTHSSDGHLYVVQHDMKGVLFADASVLCQEILSCQDMHS